VRDAQARDYTGTFQKYYAKSNIGSNFFTVIVKIFSRLISVDCIEREQAAWNSKKQYVKVRRVTRNLSGEGGVYPGV